MGRAPITSLIHHPYEPPSGFAAPQVGVYKASTVVFPSMVAVRARDWKFKTTYTYGLHGTPTTFTLEERLCALEGGRYAVLVPSGLAAITLVGCALLSAGDEVLIPSNVYGPNLTLAQNEFVRWGIAHQLYDPMNPADLAARIGPRTRLIWLEAPGSVSMEFPDLPALVRVCRAAGVRCALDNTWGAGIAFAPFDLGSGLAVDISAHALTKYPSGGGDVLMGSVITRDEDLHLQIKSTHQRLGAGVGANDAEAVLRSLPSIELRYRAHDRVARGLAKWLQSQPRVAAVLHPAVEGSPGHAEWKALCGTRNAAAGLFSIVFDADCTQDQVDQFCGALELFKIGYSWGGPTSLVMAYALAGARADWAPRGLLVRFSIGLEDEADLRADLEQALRQL